MIDVMLGDIAEMRATAVMHPVSAEWEPVTNAMRRLELSAGEQVAEQCRKLGELPIRSAVITGAGAANAEFMVHVIVRSMAEPVTESTVQRALHNGLRRCLEWGIESIAIPPIGTGAGNLDAEDVARLMLPVLLEHMRDEDFPSRVTLVVDSDYERAAFQQVLDYHDLPFLSEDPRP